MIRQRNALYGSGKSQQGTHEGAKALPVVAERGCQESLSEINNPVMMMMIMVALVGDDDDDDDTRWLDGAMNDKPSRT